MCDCNYYLIIQKKNDFIIVGPAYEYVNIQSRGIIEFENM